jgi:hypothetical protein
MKEKPVLGPPDSSGLKPLRVASGVDRKGNWKWKENKLSPKQRKKHAKFQQKMKKADKKDIWRF